MSDDDHKALREAVVGDNPVRAYLSEPVAIKPRAGWIIASGQMPGPRTRKLGFWRKWVSARLHPIGRYLRDVPPDDLREWSRD